MNSKQFKIFILFIGVALIQSGCTEVLGSMPESDQPISVISTEVKSSKVSHAIELSGSIVSENETILSSKTAGRVRAIYYNVGDKVKKGDIILSLFGDEHQINFSTAESAYQNALMNKEATYQLMSSQIENAKRQVETALVQLEAGKETSVHTKIVSEQQVALAKEKVGLAEVAIQNISNSAEQQSVSISSQKKRLISQSVILSHGILNHIHDLIGTDNKELKYTHFSHRIGQKNQQSIWSVIRELQDYQSEVENFKQFYDQKIDIEDESYIQEGFELSKKLLAESENILDTFHQLFLDTISNIYFSQSELTSARQSFITYAQQVESLLLSVSDGQVIGIEGLAQSENAIDVANSNQLRQAENELLVVKEGLLLAEKESMHQINESKSRVSVLSAQLEQMKSALVTAESNLNSQNRMMQTQVSQSKGARDLAAMALENTLIAAPFDGVILEKKVDMGMVVSPGMPLISFANPNSMKIKVEISDKEAALISVGIGADIVSDLLPGRNFKATINKVGQHADVITKKVPIELVLNGNTSGLRIGMFIRVSIHTEDESSKVMIPQKSVIMKNNEPYVYILQQDKAYLVPVRLGEVFGNYYQVLSGVYEGNQVVSKGIENLYNEAPVLTID